MKYRLLFFYLFLTSPLLAEVLKYEITGYDRTYHSYKDVCSALGHKHLLLVGVKDVGHLDCMGSIESVRSFCLKKHDSNKFLRGFVSKKMREVVCELGDAAHLSMGCDKRDKHYCKSPDAGCQSLQKIYAYNHKINHISFLEKDVDNVLNCFFSKKEKKKIAKKKFVIPGTEKPVIDKDIFSFEVSKKYDVNYLPANNSN